VFNQLNTALILLESKLFAVLSSTLKCST